MGVRWVGQRDASMVVHSAAGLAECSVALKVAMWVGQRVLMRVVWLAAGWAVRRVALMGGRSVVRKVAWKDAS